jgi:uncharacterized protein YgiM (DUF1202 family)
LNVRSGAGSDFSVIGTIESGEQVDVFEEKNAYFRIKVDG